MEYLRSVISQDVALSDSSVTDLIDLPVNPMSHLLLTLRGRNNTTTLSNYRMLKSFTDYITNVEVLYRGQAVVQGSLADLMTTVAAVTGLSPGLAQVFNTDNDFRSATFFIPFGRFLFDPDECFPATSRGEFQIRITTGAAPTGMDAIFLQLESVEILNANPSRFIKYTAYTGTGTSTGELDRDLPRGNPIVGVNLFATTVANTTSGVNTVETVKLLVDNKESFYTLANWESLHGDLKRRVPSIMALQAHVHNLNGTSSFLLGSQDTDQPELTEELMENYAYLDFDPRRDGSYMLQTEGRGRVSLRINYGDTNAMRFIPVELVSVQGGGAQAA